MHIRLLITAFIYFLSLQTSAQQIEKDYVVGTRYSLASKIMKDERKIQIFLPQAYADSDTKYPVLYVLDGQRYFLHAISLQKSFVEFRQTPGFIIVGISKNPSDRNRNFSTDSKKYLDFIKNEVITYVDTAYRTTKKRMLFGWAYGGGFVIETMTKQPHLFDAYISASPFPLTNKISKIDSLLSKDMDFDTQLYFSSGTNEGVVTEGTRALQNLLKNKGSKTMDWTFKELVGEEHRSTPFTTLYHAIKNYFKYYPELQFNTLAEFSNAGGLPYVYEYHQKRANQYGFKPQLSDWTMFSLTRNAMRADDYQQFDAFVNEFSSTNFISRLRLGRASSIAEFYLKNKQFDKAIELFTMLMEKYPDSERPLNGLGDVYKEMKKERKASTYYKKAKKLSRNKSN